MIHKPGGCSTCLNITGVGNLFSFVKQTDKCSAYLSKTQYLFKKKDVIASWINSQIINEFKFFYLLPDKVKLKIHGNKYLL